MLIVLPIEEDQSPIFKWFDNSQVYTSNHSAFCFIHHKVVIISRARTLKYIIHANEPHRAGKII